MIVSNIHTTDFNPQVLLNWIDADKHVLTNPRKQPLKFEIETRFETLNPKITVTQRIDEHGNQVTRTSRQFAHVFHSINEYSPVPKALEHKEESKVRSGIKGTLTTQECSSSAAQINAKEMRSYLTTFLQKAAQQIREGLGEESVDVRLNHLFLKILFKDVDTQKTSEIQVEFTASKRSAIPQ